MDYSKLPPVFQKIDRGDFVLPEQKKEAHEDYPLPIGYGATISQPSTVAFMLGLLKPKIGQKILDVGSGSGWTTALLAEIVGKKGRVYGIEIVPELVLFGRANVAKYDLAHATIELVGKEYGLSRHAPYDRILVSAAATQLPKELIEQLSENGVMVIPIKNSIWKIIKKKDSGIIKKEYQGFAFVPLRKK